MDESEKYLVKTVAEDIQFIRDNWNDRIDDVSLRVVSPILRKLLVEDLYSKAWRLIGFNRQPKVKAIDSDAFIFGVSEKVPLDLIDFALAGGAQYQGSVVHGCVNKRVITKDHKKAYEESKRFLDNPKEYMMSAYLDATALVVGGAKLNRRDVIIYIVNKMGGAHVDLDRDGSEREKKFKLIDSMPPVQIMGKDAIYFELLSIGQAVSRSQDAAIFLEECRKISII